MALRLVEVLLPKGPIGTAPAASRRAFLRDRQYVPGIGLSRVDGEATVLEETVLRGSDWLPGNVARIYGVPSSRGAALLTEVAVRDHVARKAFVHPSALRVSRVGEEREGVFGVRAAVRPLRLHPVRAERSGEVVRVVDAAPPVQDLEPLRTYWRERIGVGPWPIEDLYFGLVARCVGDVVIADPDAFAAVRWSELPLSRQPPGGHRVAALQRAPVGAVSDAHADARQGRAPDELARHADRAQLRVPGRDRPAADHLLRS